MNCEMCGDEVDSLLTVMVEGSEMRVCRKCARYGVEISRKRERPTASHGEMPGDTTIGSGVRISERPSWRERGAKNETAREDMFDRMIYDLAEDYDEKIKDARDAMGLTQEELAKKINEKRSIIAKLETKDIRPDEKTARKLEKILGIDLKERYQEL